MICVAVIALASAANCWQSDTVQAPDDGGAGRGGVVGTAGVGGSGGMAGTAGVGGGGGGCGPPYNVVCLTSAGVCPASPVMPLCVAGWFCPRGGVPGPCTCSASQEPQCPCPFSWQCVTGGDGGGGGSGGRGGDPGFAGRGGGGGTSPACIDEPTLAACDARSDCHAVFEDPGMCSCASPGCCARFSRCADGELAACAGVAIACDTVAPHCEQPYVVSYTTACYEGCVRETECLPP